MQRIIALACTALLTFGTARADTTLVVSMAADPTGLDPEAVLNNTSGFVMATIYDGLIRYKSGTVEVEPGLAESWDVSGDGLTYAFHLRKGVKYHDGTPFNAQALIATLDRQLNKNDPNYIYNSGPVQSYMDFTYGSVTSYRALDDSHRGSENEDAVGRAARESGDGMEWRRQPDCGREIRQGIPQSSGRHRTIHLPRVA